MGCQKQGRVNAAEPESVSGQSNSQNCPFAGSLGRALILVHVVRQRFPSDSGREKSVLFKLINTSQLGPNLLFGYYRLRDRLESWHVLKKLWLSHQLN